MVVSKQSCTDRLYRYQQSVWKFLRWAYRRVYIIDGLLSIRPMVQRLPSSEEVGRWEGVGIKIFGRLNRTSCVSKNRQRSLPFACHGAILLWRTTFGRSNSNCRSFSKGICKRPRGYLCHVSRLIRSHSGLGVSVVHVVLGCCSVSSDRFRHVAPPPHCVRF